jgi:hypothetical protein
MPDDAFAGSHQHAVPIGNFLATHQKQIMIYSYIHRGNDWGDTASGWRDTGKRKEAGHYSGLLTTLFKLFAGALLPTPKEYQSPIFLTCHQCW